MNTACSVAKSLQNLCKFKSLRIDPPPNFVAALGCLCLTEYIAFYPDISGNSIVYDNGIWEDEVDTEVWSKWTSQPGVAKQLKHIEASAESASFHALIINVDTYDLYEADEELARDFLYKHYITTKGLPLV